MTSTQIYAGGVEGALNPIPHLQNLAEGILTNNPDKAREGLGGLLLNSAGCIGCSTVAQNVVPSLSPAQINQIAGTGFLTFVATGDPYLVIFSVLADAQQAIEEVKLANDQASPPAPPIPPAPRAPQIYSTQATCLLEHNGMIWAGYSGSIEFADEGGQSSVYPAVDLRKGDTITVNSPDCFWSNPETGQVWLNEAVMLYEQYIPAPNSSPSAIKQFLVGKRKV